MLSLFSSVSVILQISELNNKTAKALMLKTLSLVLLLIPVLHQTGSKFKEAPLAGLIRSFMSASAPPVLLSVAPK